MSSTSDTTDRLEALVVQIAAGITVSPRYECKINEANLPTFIMLPQGARRERAGAGDYRIIRDYLLFMLVQTVCDTNEQERQAAREACYPYLDSVPHFFMQRRFLEYNDAGLPGVVDTSPLVDDGAQLTTYSGDEFGGIRFRLSVTTGEEV